MSSRCFLCIEKSLQRIRNLVKERREISWIAKSCCKSNTGCIDLTYLFDLWPFLVYHKRQHSSLNHQKQSAKNHVENVCDCCFHSVAVWLWTEHFPYMQILIFDTKCVQYATLTPAHHSFQYFSTPQALELILSQALFMIVCSKRSFCLQF